MAAIKMVKKTNPIAYMTKSGEPVEAVTIESIRVSLTKIKPLLTSSDDQTELMKHRDRTRKSLKRGLENLLERKLICRENDNQDSTNVIVWMLCD